MILIRQYPKQFTPGPAAPVLVTLAMPALYKPLSASFENLPGTSSLSSLMRGTTWFLLTARVQEGPAQDRRFLIALPGDQLPDARLQTHDTGDPASLQWSFWQGLHVPTTSDTRLAFTVFDVTHLKLKGYE